MTPIEDIKKLERAIADDTERSHAYFLHASEENKNYASAAREYRNDLIFQLTTSLIADWKAMRGEIQKCGDKIISQQHEIERLTDETMKDDKETKQC